jgi:hypothetical protein
MAGSTIQDVCVQVAARIMSPHSFLRQLHQSLQQASHPVNGGSV